MASFEEYTWHKSHVVWHFPPSACVHVTHGTWNMDHESKRTRKVRGSFLSLGSNQGIAQERRKNLVEGRKRK